jgi:hypothetical protein
MEITLVADVLAWQQGQQPNNGWVLIGAESGSHTARRFDSRESPNAADRPTLIVIYSATAVEPQTWSAIKATYR